MGIPARSHTAQPPHLNHDQLVAAQAETLDHPRRRYGEHEYMQFATEHPGWEATSWRSRSTFSFDEQLAVLEQILGPLAEWSRTWAELEQQLLSMGRRPTDDGSASVDALVAAGQFRFTVKVDAVLRLDIGALLRLREQVSGRD